MKKIRRSVFVKTKFIYFLFFIFYSCGNSKNPEQIPGEKPEISGKDILQIDPRTFTESGFVLSDIADDIKYIPLDNRIPFGTITSLKLVNNSFFLNIEETHLIKFDNTGKNPQLIGRKGRGPGEYDFCESYAIDPGTGDIYILGKRNVIMAYSPGGKFIREFQLPHGKDGSLIHDIEFIGSYLFLAQYIEQGQSEFNWIITDTIGNIISKRPNFIPPFESHTGQGGGISKFNDEINYWDIYNDTVFTISKDLSYRARCIFPPGKYRRRQEDIKVSSPQQYFEEMTKICMTLNLKETNNFWVYKYRFNSYGVAFIDKRNKKAKLSFHPVESWGIDNDLDAGPIFLPESYSVENGHEYLIGVVSSYKILAYLASDAFKNSNPKYPEKKKELENLANILKETDNPILMMVRLRK
jgi:hypothetical protein